jgi:hypothetical protein
MNGSWLFVTTSVTKVCGFTDLLIELPYWGVVAHALLSPEKYGCHVRGGPFVVSASPINSLRLVLYFLSLTELSRPVYGGVSYTPPPLPTASSTKRRPERDNATGPECGRSNLQTHRTTPPQTQPPTQKSLFSRHNLTRLNIFVQSQRLVL